MRRILLKPAEAPDLSLETVDDQLSVAVEDLAKDYHVVIPADHMVDPPLLANGMKAAFLCTDFQAFERLRRMDLPGDLLFKPSAVARLDMMRETRRTLVTARPLREGEVITDADLSEILGGSGVAVAWREQMVGRTALYDMMEGMPVDFGFLSEDPVGDNQRASHAPKADTTAPDSSKRAFKGEIL